MREMPDYKEKARKALKKNSLYGPDLNLSKLLKKVKGTENLLEKRDLMEASTIASRSGIDAKLRGRSASYFQIDREVLIEEISRRFEGKVELMNIRKAFEKYNWVKDYWWKIVSVDQDKFTASVELNLDNGYFIRILPNQRVKLPIQACLMIYHDETTQNVHNIVIAEPNSEAQIITGCMIKPLSKGLHLGVTEFYLKKGSKITYTMIHNWSKNTHVRPRSAAILEDKAVLINNYVNLRTVGSIQMYPVFYCKGDGSRVSVNSILFGDRNSYIDVGAKVVLEGYDARGEIISRSVAKDEAKIYARGAITGKSGFSKGHLECRGLLLSDNASIYAIPELIGRRKGSELSHEAAIGRISEEQIEYLMSRGLSMRGAVSLIIKGFMDVGILNLPPRLSSQIKSLIDLTTEKAF